MGTYEQAFTEIYEILKYMPENIVSRIPESVLKTIKYNRDLNYDFKIDETKKFSEQKLSHKTYKVIIKVLNNLYQFDGFIDTGNRLKSPINNKSIILIDQIIPYIKSYYVPYKALNYEGLLECFKPDKIIINEIEINNCIIGISKDKLNIDGYNCILPYCIKEEL